MSDHGHLDDAWRLTACLARGYSLCHNGRLPRDASWITRKLGLRLRLPCLSPTPAPRHHLRLPCPSPPSCSWTRLPCPSPPSCSWSRERQLCPTTSPAPGPESGNSACHQPCLSPVSLLVLLPGPGYSRKWMQPCPCATHGCTQKRVEERYRARVLHPTSGYLAVVPTDPGEDSTLLGAPRSSMLSGSDVSMD